ncbi:hypothetical protein [Clostridium aciditolerans]|uniref:Uncharacterized protein n=1 Tax=Clostridium aciditolerans TaxID=339861 RepID=A0A934HPV9_9CLOT|nr:hypothetical protein [Clostridium aciditolerans]MBI6872256.1 hypothetical protein [Clostridium aciditolerans]
MSTMKEFVFYPRFVQFQGVRGVTVDNSHKILNEIVRDEELSLGNRQVGNRSYHVFYFKNDCFAVYYHGGGTDALFTSRSLDEVLDYINGLNPEDFK